MELSRFRAGDLIAAAGAVALLVVMFLEWYEAAGIGVNAWEAFSVTDVWLAVTALAALALAAVTASHRSPALPVAASVVTSALGVLAALLVLYRILNQPGPNDLVEAKLGAFLGFVSVLAIAAGAWRSMRDERWAVEPAPVDVRPAPPAEGPRDPAPPPEAEPRA